MLSAGRGRAGWGVMAICLMIDFEFKAKLIRMHPSQNEGGAEADSLRGDCYWQMGAQFPEEDALPPLPIRRGQSLVFTLLTHLYCSFLCNQWGQELNSGWWNVGGGGDATLGLAWLLKASLVISSSFSLLSWPWYNVLWMAGDCPVGLWHK